MPVKPKKALGQHFLNDQDIARRIADTLNGYPELPLLEVGPGMGVLTEYLLQNHPASEVTLAELDGESVRWLKAHLPQPQPRIVEGDFLQMDLDKFFPGSGPFTVIGNYPYNISTQIFFKVLDYKDRVICCSGMLQKEVAERLAAREGGRTRGILSVLLQAWYDVEYLFTVDEHVFTPVPKVKSGVVRMVRNNVTDLGCDPALFRTVVKPTFGQRRKTIRNSARALLGTAPVPESPLMARRPEQLSVQQASELTTPISDPRTR